MVNSMENIFQDKELSQLVTTQQEEVLTTNISNLKSNHIVKLDLS